MPLSLTACLIFHLTWEDSRKFAPEWKLLSSALGQRGCGARIEVREKNGE